MKDINKLREKMKALSNQGTDYIKHIGKYVELANVLPQENKDIKDMPIDNKKKD